MDIKLDELSQFLPNANWFGDEMLRGAYLTLPPVTEIGGRFFITYDSMSWRRKDPGNDPAQNSRRAATSRCRMPLTNYCGTLRLRP